MIRGKKPNAVGELFLHATLQHVPVHQLADDLQLYGVLVRFATGYQVGDLHDGGLPLDIVVIRVRSAIQSSGRICFWLPPRTKVGDLDHFGFGFLVFNVVPIPIHPNIGDLQSRRNGFLHPVAAAQCSTVV